jgi:hypothetical protein
MTKQAIFTSEAIRRYSSAIVPYQKPRIFCAGVLLAFAAMFPMQALAGKVVNLTCDNGARVSIRELYSVSTHRYVLGDLIEVGMWGERFQGEP